MIESTNDKENIMKIDYNRLVYSSSGLIHNSIQNLKFFLDNNLTHEEYELERNEKLRYSILDDLSELIRYLNSSDMIPEYDLKLVITPRFSKEDLR